MKSTMPNRSAHECHCTWFKWAVNEEACPVVFDELMNEYHLKHEDGATSLFYHCPFCGGRAPKSLRASYWTKVSHEECCRLQGLTLRVKTAAELFEAFGQPDDYFDMGGVLESPGSVGPPAPRQINPRRVVYKNLSKTAEVHVMIDGHDHLSFSYQGRYIGPSQHLDQSGTESAFHP